MSNNNESKEIFVFKLADRLFKFLWIATQEFYSCIKSENFPVWRYCGVGIMFSYYLLFDLDIKLAQFFGSEFYLEASNYKLALTLFSAASPLFQECCRVS